MLEPIAVGEFKSHEEAERGVRALGKAGIDWARISIVGKDLELEEHAVGSRELDDRIKFAGSFGAAGGALAGLLVGSFVTDLPVFGHFLILGPLASAIFNALVGTGVGGFVGALAGALIWIALPDDRTIQFQSSIIPGRYVVMVKGTATEMQLSHTTLGSLHPDQFDPRNHRAA